MGSLKFETAGTLMKWAAVGGFVSGLVGAVFSSAITAIHPIYSFFVPTTLSSKLPFNCPVIPDIQSIQNNAKPYWILSSFAWPAFFINKATIGFFLGTGETKIWSLSTVVSSVSSIAIFYFLINTVNKTAVYGMSNMIPEYVFLILTILCFGRKKYVEQFKFLKNNMFAKHGLKISWQAATDGSQLLLKDLALTFQKSGSLILAAHLGLGQQYQLLLYGNLQSNFGYSYGGQNSGSVFPILLGYAMRLSGSRLIGSRNYIGFMRLFKGYFIGCILFGFVSFLSLILTRNAIPYYYVSNDICTYQEYECSKSTYNHVFHNIDNGTIFLACMAWVNTIFSILQSTLYAISDFAYIRNTACITCITAFIPLACLAFWYFQSTMSLYVAQNVPIIILTILNMHRVFYVILPNIETFVANQITEGTEVRSSLMEPNDQHADIATNDDSADDNKQNENL